VSNDSKALGQRIKGLRLLAGFTLRQLSKRYSEIEGLVKASEQKPKPSDVNEACLTISQNMGQLTHEDRRRVLEALKIKVHTGEAIRIEGTLPIPAPSIELQLLRGG